MTALPASAGPFPGDSAGARTGDRPIHRAGRSAGLGARPPAVGNAAAGLAGLLSSLGITDAGTRGGVEDAVRAELAARGLDAEVLELRWGTLTLTAPPQAAHLLRFDTDNLLACLEEQHPGTVSRIQVRVRRS